MATSAVDGAPLLIGELAVIYDLIYAGIELLRGMIAEETATNLALDIEPVFLFRFVSFHVLIYATIVFLLGVSAESTTANLALAIR